MQIASALTVVQVNDTLSSWFIETQLYGKQRGVRAILCELEHSNGDIALPNAFIIHKQMSCTQLQQGLQEYTGKLCLVDTTDTVATVLSPIIPVLQMHSACSATFYNDSLRTITLQFVDGTAKQQRRAIFSLVQEADPCLEQTQNVLLRYPFGTVWITEDPRCGNQMLTITYAVKE